MKAVVANKTASGAGRDDASEAFFMDFAERAKPRAGVINHMSVSMLLPCIGNDDGQGYAWCRRVPPQRPANSHGDVVQ